MDAIDVHGHYGPYRRGVNALIDQLMSADLATVLRRAALARTALTFVSPIHGLLPRGEADTVAANEEAARLVSAERALRQWVIIDPRDARTFGQAADLLPEPWCVGIKLHPEEHAYPICEQALAIFESAACHRAVIMSHSGEANSLPEDFVPWADEFPEVTVILSHLGCNCDGDPSHQVRAVAAARRPRGWKRVIRTTVRASSSPIKCDTMMPAASSSSGRT